MANTVSIQNRLNWIDWAKAIAISFVVFGHTPQTVGSPLVCFITQFHIPLFFFISGYLTKKEYMNKQTAKKYFHSLIIPYLCYNLIFYPYWVARYLIENPNHYWYEFSQAYHWNIHVPTFFSIFRIIEWRHMVYIRTPYYEVHSRLG